MKDFVNLQPAYDEMFRPEIEAAIARFPLEFPVKSCPGHMFTVVGGRWDRVGPRLYLAPLDGFDYGLEGEPDALLGQIWS